MVHILPHSCLLVSHARNLHLLSLRQRVLALLFPDICVLGSSSSG